jgi:tetratricopeptide (TPR) repeat protein
MLNWIAARFAPSYALPMEVDPNNPIVKLCAEGISAEMAGRTEQAANLYRQAWEARTDDYDACVAAHYLARIQRTTQDALYWNTEALRHAETVNDERVVGFYPSLYLNIGKAHEDAGNKQEARKFYGLAVEKAALLPEGKYADMVKRGSAQGLERVSG